MKLLLESSAELVLTGVEVTGIWRWLNVELPDVQNKRVDLLGETLDGHLVHIEIQSTNNPAMPFRMAEYGLQIYRKYGRFPRQTVLYVGLEPLRMEAALTFPRLQFQYRLVDIRDMDGDRLLSSSSVGDNVIAILANVRDRDGAVRQVLRTIADLPGEQRESVLKQLLIVSGLRRLEEYVEREARKMPILNDIMDHKVLGREFKKGRQEGLQEGRLEMLHELLEKRFGAVPTGIADKLKNCTPGELKELAIRLLDARSLAELFSGLQ